MTWSDEVHNNRYQAAITRATAERRLRKRGLPVPVMETAQAGPVLAMVAIVSGLVAWQRFGGQVRTALSQNPLVQQFRTLIFGPGSSAPRPSATKSTGKSNSTSGKVAARKPAVVTPTPAQAAAAAAEARLYAAQPSPRLVPPVPSRPPQTDPQPQASTSAAEPSDVPGRSGPSATSGASSSSGGSKKKKSGKKRR